MVQALARLVAFELREDVQPPELGNADGWYGYAVDDAVKLFRCSRAKVVQHALSQCAQAVFLIEEARPFHRAHLVPPRPVLTKHTLNQ